MTTFTVLSFKKLQTQLLKMSAKHLGGGGGRYSYKSHRNWSVLQSFLAVCCVKFHFLTCGHSFMVTTVAMVTRHVLRKVRPEAEETAEYSASITTDDN
jgi:hypothetical protein